LSSVAPFQYNPAPPALKEGPEIYHGSPLNGDIGRHNKFPRRKDHGPLNDIGQIPNISRPTVFPEQFFHAGAESFGPVQQIVFLFQKKIRQLKDIFPRSRNGGRVSRTTFRQAYLNMRHGHVSGR